jgi:hypothetical protein
MTLNMNQLAAMEGATHNSEMPADIVRLLETEYYSKSRKQMIRLGELTLPHFLRALALHGHKGLRKNSVRSQKGWTDGRRARHSAMMKKRHFALQGGL